MNKITPLHRKTFKAGSRTYYHSSVFFPAPVKKDVHVLYGFLRVADDFVDRIPQDSSSFHAFVKRYRSAVGGERTYLPLENSGFESISESVARANPERFAAFIRKQIDQYFAWQREAEQGYRYIPKRYLVPIKTASDMYVWTARQIAADPFVVFEKKVKPSKGRVLLTALANLLTASAGP